MSPVPPHTVPRNSKGEGAGAGVEAAEAATAATAARAAATAAKSAEEAAKRKQQNDRVQARRAEWWADAMARSPPQTARRNSKGQGAAASVEAAEAATTTAARAAEDAWVGTGRLARAQEEWRQLQLRWGGS